MTEWEKVDPKVWEPKQSGDFVEGIYIIKREGLGVHKSNMYILENNQKQIGVWGSAILDQKMELVKVGERVKIEFGGKEETKDKKPVNIYEIYKEKKEGEDQEV